MRSDLTIYTKDFEKYDSGLVLGLAINNCPTRSCIVLNVYFFFLCNTLAYIDILFKIKGDKIIWGKIIFDKIFMVNRFFAIIFLILQYLLVTSISHAAHFDLLKDKEYSLELFSTDYNSKNTHNLLLKIKLEDGWKLLAASKEDQNLSPIISVKNASSIKSINKAIDITWPEPLLSEQKDSFIYKNEVLIPIKIDTDEIYQDLKLEIDVTLNICKDVCLNKNHHFMIAVPGIDYDLVSYELIKSVSDKSVSEPALPIVEKSFLLILVLSFIGGFILNFMPCVLPVISLKVLSIIRAKDDIDNARHHFIATAAGTIVFFIIIGIVISFFKSLGQYVGLGFNFQYPVFIVTLVLLIILFAAILNDTLHIDVPSGVKQYIFKYCEQTKFFGSFLSGMFAALLATPCTAPFLGVAISVALTLSVAKMLISFALMGAGMAFPFIMLSVFPKFVRFIPSPGPWINVFKKFLEILLYLTVVWLIWIFSAQLGFYSAVALFLSGLLFKFLLEKRTELSKKMKVIFLSIVIIASYAVPIKTSIVEIQQEQIINDIWKPFYIRDIEKYINDDKIVIVDITAEWCLSCKYNKTLVWNNPFMVRFLRENGIVGLKGDYTVRSKEIEKFLVSYSQYGIPFTVVFSKSYPNGLILPTILKYSDVVEAIKKVSQMALEGQ